MTTKSFFSKSFLSAEQLKHPIPSCYHPALCSRNEVKYSIVTVSGIYMENHPSPKTRTCILDRSYMFLYNRRCWENRTGMRPSAEVQLFLFGLWVRGSSYPKFSWTQSSWTWHLWWELRLCLRMPKVTMSTSKSIEVLQQLAEHPLTLTSVTRWVHFQTIFHRSCGSICPYRYPRWQQDTEKWIISRGQGGQGSCVPQSVFPWLPVHYAVR